MATYGGSQGAAQLQFDDGASCRRWLESLPLTNIPAAHQTLARQISQVRVAGFAPVEFLRVLEALREAVAYVQSEMARKYAARPLPLDHAETVSWTQVMTLWQEVLDGYLQCRDAYMRGEAGLRKHGPLIVMRCLRYTTCLMFEHYRVYRQPPTELWRKLCQVYVSAEQNGFVHAPVADADGESSCAAAFCQALLAHLANPFALSGRQMEFLARWIEQWSRHVVLASQPMSRPPAPLLAIDLAAGSGPVFADGLQPLTSLLYLDLEPLGQVLRQTITQLKQGRTPAQLGLGEDARQPGCENLLMLLYIQWCRAGTGRGEERVPTGETASVCLGMHAAHFQISGRAFRAPGSGLTRQEERDIEMFGHVTERTERMMASEASAAVESWQLVNHSGSGFMCMLRGAEVRTRLAHNQMVAVRRDTGRLYSLGVVQWLRVEENNDLYVGVRLFPGGARTVSVRPVNFNAPNALKGFERAFLLPEIAAPSTPATLILPGGWYQAGRFVEIHGTGKHTAKLVGLFEKGSDFDRCLITLA